MEERNTDKPFMLCCHFKATHEPWDFPERMKHLYDDVTFPEPDTMMEFDTIASGRTFTGRQLENMGWRWEQASKGPGGANIPNSLQHRRHGQYLRPKEDISENDKDYLRCGATIDDNIGRLLRYLDEKVGKEYHRHLCIRPRILPGRTWIL